MVMTMVVIYDGDLLTVFAIIGDDEVIVPRHDEFWGRC